MKWFFQVYELENMLPVFSKWKVGSTCWSMKEQMRKLHEKGMTQHSHLFSVNRCVSLFPSIPPHPFLQFNHLHSPPPPTDSPPFPPHCLLATNSLFPLFIAFKPNPSVFEWSDFMLYRFLFWNRKQRTCTTLCPSQGHELHTHTHAPCVTFWIAKVTNYALCVLLNIIKTSYRL